MQALQWLHELSFISSRVEVRCAYHPSTYPHQYSTWYEAMQAQQRLHELSFILLETSRVEIRPTCLHTPVDRNKAH